ncbi:hypothetical protein DVH24_041354, partial [Malus domestica]
QFTAIGRSHLRLDAKSFRYDFKSQGKKRQDSSRGMHAAAETPPGAPSHLSSLLSLSLITAKQWPFWFPSLSFSSFPIYICSAPLLFSSPLLLTFAFTSLPFLICSAVNLFRLAGASSLSHAQHHSGLEWGFEKVDVLLYVARGNGILQPHQMINELENVIMEDEGMQKLKDSSLISKVLQAAQDIALYVRVNAYELSVDHLSVAEYLRFKEELMDGECNDKYVLELDLEPFNA